MFLKLSEISPEPFCVTLNRKIDLFEDSAKFLGSVQSEIQKSSTLNFFDDLRFGREDVICDPFDNGTGSGGAQHRLTLKFHLKSGQTEGQHSSDFAQWRSSVQCIRPLSHSLNAKTFRTSESLSS
jgi:hypothetical protein